MLPISLRRLDRQAHDTGVPVDLDASAGLLIAVKLPGATSLDAAYSELCAKGVAFIRPPANYPWNARCVYFAGPDGELWELYAWLSGGALGDIARDAAPGQ